MKKFLALILALVMALSLVACGEKAPAADDGAADAGTEVKDTIRFQIKNEPTSVDLQNDGTMLGGLLCDQIYGKLVTFNEKSEIVGELAESWEWNDDFTQITFKIRENAKFSDGSDITADDFIYTFSTDSAKANTYMAPIASMEAPDAKTLVLNLKSSNSSMLKFLTTYHTGVVPAGSMEATDIARGATAYSGPYALAKWELGQDMVLEANPYWWNAENVAIKTVDYEFIADENSALVALEAGEIDFMFMAATLGVTSVETIATNDKLATIACDQATAGMLCLNFVMPELDDVNVRQAMNLALDRAAIAKVSTTGTPAGNVFTAPYFGDDYIPGHDAPAVDLAKAKEFMAASAYPNGFTVELKTPVMFSKAAAIVQSNLAEIGITVEITEIDASIWVDSMIKGDYQMAFMTYGNLINDLTGFINLYDPAAALHFNFDTDSTSFDLMSAAFSVAGADRTAALTEFADFCEADLPYLGLFMENAIYGHSADLYVPTPSGCGYDIAGMYWK